jgi:hypothetical protein
MAARPNELIAFFQAALQRRRLYDGPVDGSVNPALKDAVARYREALGLSREPKLSLDFFKAYLGADPPPVEARLAAAPAAVASPVTQPATLAWNALPAEAKPALALQIATRNDTQRWARGEPVQLTIRPNRDAHVYCFHQDEDGRVTRFFPNRFRQDSWVPSATGVQLPGAMRFEIVMNRRGVPENLACFATPGDVLARLPAALGRPDFDALPVASLDALRSAFAEAAPGELAQQSIQLRPR